MTVEMQDQMITVMNVVFVLTALGLIAAVVGLVATLVGTRRERMVRQLSIPSFYLPRLSVATHGRRDH